MRSHAIAGEGASILRDRRRIVALFKCSCTFVLLLPTRLQVACECMKCFGPTLQVRCDSYLRDCRWFVVHYSFCTVAFVLARTVSQEV